MSRDFSFGPEDETEDVNDPDHGSGGTGGGQDR